MGLCNSPDIFQEIISERFVGLDTLCVYIDDLFHVTKVFWKENRTVLEEIFTRLQKARIKVNARKLGFGAHKFDYFGYHFTRDRIVPIPNKVKAIQAQTVPKTCKNCVSLSV